LWRARLCGPGGNPCVPRGKFNVQLSSKLLAGTGWPSLEYVTTGGFWNALGDLDRSSPTVIRNLLLTFIKHLKRSVETYEVLE